MDSRESLQRLVQEKLGDCLFLAVSNREPYIHSYQGDEVVCRVPASGLTTALDPVLRACGGTWVAHGSGDADRETTDEKGRVKVPPGNPLYALKRVWLTKEEEDGYYYGFSNEALWPLSHRVFVRPLFNLADWQAYRRVNRHFAEAVLEEIGNRKALVFIQDYHLALLSRLIKRAAPQVITAQFWHIPWASSDTFRICPWGEELLDGLLGNDLLGFHIQYHCNNFLETAEVGIEARVDWERFAVTRGRRRTLVRPFPISVDFHHIEEEAWEGSVDEEMARLRDELGLDYEFIGVGMDRLDYTKGIPERLRALDRFFQRYPEYRERLVFLELGVPSRTHIKSYQLLNDEVDHLVDEINWKYGSGKWKPIVYLKEHAPPQTLHAARRLANFCLVSSLHDGMNLVAKEFVAARRDGDGVLILSSFTGAARELGDALLVNPFATDEVAEAIKMSLEMPTEERKTRMRHMRAVVREHDIYHWASSIITGLARLAR